MGSTDAADQPVALVLGAAVWANEQPSPTLRRRVDHAIALYHSGRVAKIVASGGLGQHPPSEAMVMARLCRVRGVPEDAILLEDHATNTLDNIRFSARLAPNARFVIVTDLYHGPRAWITARALGLGARVSCPAPKGTRPVSTLKSWLREAIALPFYVVKLAALRISGRL